MSSKRESARLSRGAYTEPKEDDFSGNSSDSDDESQDTNKIVCSLYIVIKTLSVRYLGQLLPVQRRSAPVATTFYSPYRYLLCTAYIFSRLDVRGWRYGWPGLASDYVNNADPTAATCMQRDDSCCICGKGVSADEEDLKCTYTNKPFQCSRIAHASCVEFPTDPCAPATQPTA